jgi:hypothetical protein
MTEIERSRASNNVMFGVETTFSIVFGFRRFGNIERFLTVTVRSIIDRQPIGEILQNGFCTQLKATGRFLSLRLRSTEKIHLRGSRLGELFPEDYR